MFGPKRPFGVLVGNALSCLDRIPPRIAQCCVTSPPYWGQRDYQHDDQIGCESSPDAYVETIVAVLREVRRILNQNGVCWLNLANTSSGGGGYAPNAPSNLAGSKQSSNRGTKRGPRPIPDGFKRKDLVLLPFMVAESLRQDGWYLRNLIVWVKTNAFPEPLKDRPSRCYENILMLTKNEHYLYDTNGYVERTENGHRKLRDVWEFPTGDYQPNHNAVFPEELPNRCIALSTKPGHLVFDPFSGSGTTGVAAVKLKRRYLGVELVEATAKESEKRIASAFALRKMLSI